MLERGEIDIAPAGFAMTKGRSTVVDYLPSVDQSFDQLFLRNPEDVMRWNAYKEPLTDFAWIAVALFMLLTPPILAGIVYYSKEFAMYHVQV